MNNKHKHQGMRFIDFTDGTIVPTEPGSYVVLLDDSQYITCKAIFQGDDFIKFIPVHGQLEIKPLQILAWAWLPAAKKILAELYPAAINRGNVLPLPIVKEILL